MDKRLVPKRLTDFAKELATNDKPASAWMDELRRARYSGQLVVLTKGGKKNAPLYTNDYYLQKYLKSEYQIERSAYAPV